jgi:hypothetical protein
MSATDKSIYSSMINLDLKSSMQSPPEIAQLKDIVRATLLAEWREEDAFQVPLILHTLLSVDKDRTLLNEIMDDVLAERMRHLISALFSARPLRRNGQYQPLSDYIIFLLAQALTTMYKSTPLSGYALDNTSSSGDDVVSIGGLPKKAIPDGAASQLSVGLSRCAEVSFNELCRQLAFRSAGDRTNFDPIRYLLFSF